MSEVDIQTPGLAKLSLPKGGVLIFDKSDVRLIRSILEHIRPKRRRKIADGALARSSDPDTSFAAASSVDAARWEKIVRDAIAALGTATSWEVAQHLSVDQYGSISPRFQPLYQKGLIELTGEKRPGPNGKAMQVWRCVV